LYFKATEDGSTTFSFSNVEPDVESVAAATYSLSTESNPEEGQLPEAGIFNSYTVILSGFVLLIVGLFFNQLMNGFSFLSSRSKQAKMERRRNNLESKI